MPENHHNHRSAAGGLLMALILAAVMIAAPVNAQTVLDEVIDDTGISSTTYEVNGSYGVSPSPSKLRINNAENIPLLDFSLMYFSKIYNSNASINANQTSVTFEMSGQTVGSGLATYYRDSQLNGYITVSGKFNQSLGTGSKTVDIKGPGGRSLYSCLDDLRVTSTTSTQKTTGVMAANQMGLIGGGTHPVGYVYTGKYTINQLYPFWHRVIIANATALSYDVTVIKSLSDISYSSNVIISGKSGEYLNNTGIDNEYVNIGNQDLPISVHITSDAGNYNFIYSPYNEEPTPTPTGEPPVMRTGTVTMTDNNGTTITGFDVMAVNHYTGQEYTASTDTDVAIITLPMDQKTQMRDPWSGEYEDVPIGYYLFFGQAAGYKMLYEDGIRVSVVPEKYTSYQLCDIGVTSESGHLTGKHQFQLRSRSDNSILQTGTLSAKSATTGEWFNTTVSGGIATLILPYDTANPISQYAGNYYVYATSPGYEDSDYGTQIVVMPHTVSEIRDIHLTPIGGIPTPGNVTLRIQAFSETGPGVVNAEIFIAGVLGEGASLWDTYTASSTGYLAVSVPANSTYDIVASGAGYYDSARRVEVLTEDPALIEMKLYLTGAPTLEPTTQPTGWPTTQPTTQPTGGIPDEDDDSEGFLMQAVRGIGLAFGVGFATAKLIFGMLLALSIGYATAKQLRGGAAEFALGLLGGTLLGVLIGLLPVWIIVVLLLVVGLYIGNRYVGGGNNG